MEEGGAVLSALHWRRARRENLVGHKLEYHTDASEGRRGPLRFTALQGNNSGRASRG